MHLMNALYVSSIPYMRCHVYACVHVVFSESVVSVFLLQLSLSPLSHSTFYSSQGSYFRYLYQLYFTNPKHISKSTSESAI